MAGKNYKNVYTILEKVKKGEIKSHYKNDEGGLFGKLNFYKKEDLIKPHMHWLDEDRIDRIMDIYFQDPKNIKENFEKFSKTAGYTRLDATNKPDFDKYLTEVKKKYKTFPKHIVKDIFKMFYHKMDKLEFEERTDANYTKYKFLEKANNPVAKIMCEGSNLKSAIFARNILGYYITKLINMEYIDPDQADKVNKGLEGGNEFDNSDIDSALDDLLNSKQAQNELEKVMDKSTDLCKQMDGAMDQDLQEKMFDNVTAPGSDSTAGNLSPDYIRTVSQQLSRIKLSIGSLKERIKKLLDKSVSYFSSKTVTEYEDLLNSDNIAGLEDYALLHPKLRKIFIEDVLVKETKAVGKIDIYVDISGSMSSGCGVQNDDGNTITRLDFCKAFTAKLLEMDMLNNVYLFNNKVTKYKTDIVSISMIDTDGGTTINNAVRSIEKNGVNAIIITDAEDGCDTYSDKAFFIGLKGCNFNHFNPKTLQQYREAEQIVVFDGESIKKVNQQGRVIQ